MTGDADLRTITRALEDARAAGGSYKRQRDAEQVRADTAEAEVERLLTFEAMYRLAVRDWDFAVAERDAARAGLATAQATLAEVRGLHRPISTHDECPHEDQDACDAWETTDGLIVCGPSLGSVCDECRNEDGDRYVEWPCATIRALDGAES